MIPNDTGRTGGNKTGLYVVYEREYILKRKKCLITEFQCYIFHSNTIYE